MKYVFEKGISMPVCAFKDDIYFNPLSGEVLTIEQERLVKQSKNSIALYSDKTNGTKLLTSSEQCLFTGINLWDLHEMLKEVF